MKNKINFITGETYTLSELFSGERKIIIPDLQRDYCWGDEIHTEEKKELVSGFVGNLQGLYNQFENETKKENLSLGLIYGYEVPENHIQLCDGQQRITTLFLLLGMLNRRSGNNAFRARLISDSEYREGDKDPYLQYAIRESSLYFLHDLVCHFFIVNKEDKDSASDISGIENCSWFFNEYKYDPSIQSMLKALNKIDACIKDKDSSWCCKFGDFLANRLTFLYYDLVDRRNGEETFVVINTTGEPLSATQNLKPLVANAENNKNYNSKTNNSLPEDWEEIETWFWKNRQKDKNDTADAGFNEFLRWVTMLEGADKDKIKQILAEGRYTFPVDGIAFSTIYEYWKIVNFLFENWDYKDSLKKEYLSPSGNPNMKGYKVIGQIDCFILLPLIAYCKAHENTVSDNKNKNLYRLYKFLQNLSRIANVGKNVNDLVFDAIAIARNYDDIVDIVDDRKQPFKKPTISETILTEEERLKLKILRNNEREYIEQAFWNAQDDDDHKCHKIWGGQIMPLIRWATANHVFNLDSFNKYLETFDAVFAGECDSNIDIVRRALLTMKLNGYPRIFRGYTNYSFGWEWSDWQTLINDNINEFKTFLDDLHDDPATDITLKCQKMIDSFDDNTNKWYNFIKHEELLKYCEQKNIQKDNGGNWLLIKKQYATTYISLQDMMNLIELQEKLQNKNCECKIVDNHLQYNIDNSGSGQEFHIQSNNGKWTIRKYGNDNKCYDSIVTIDNIIMLLQEETVK